MSLVRSFKNKTISWEEYERTYNALLNSRAQDIKLVMNNICTPHSKTPSGKDLILLCWCPDVEICHRRLAAEWLKNLGYGVTIN